MKIKVLGTCGEIEESSPYHTKKSGVLLDNKLLLDCGEERFLDYQPHALLLTHLHPDHAYFVRHGQVPVLDTLGVYAPEGYKDMPITVVKKPFTFDSYTITPIPTIHSIKVKSIAYIVEHAGKRILYTGDMIWINKKYHPLLGELDLVITEASFIRTGGVVRRNKTTGELFGHTGVPNLLHLFKKHTKTILLVHFGAWFFEDMHTSRAQLAHLSRENNLTIIVGYDGLDFKI